MFLGIKEKLAILIQILCGTVYYRINSKEYWWTNTDQIFRSFLPPLQTRKICASYTGTIFDQQVLGLGTPASNAGLKAGDVLVQVTAKRKEKKTTFTFAIKTFDNFGLFMSRILFCQPSWCCCRWRTKLSQCSPIQRRSSVSGGSLVILF